MPRFTVGCPPRDSVIGVGNACDSSTYISYYSSANSRGAPDGIFPKNLQTAKKNWLRFPHPKKGFGKKSKPVDPWNTSELDHWSRGANFLSSFGTCCCFECSGPSTWPKKAERSGEKLGDACLCVIWKWSPQTIQFPTNGRKCMKIYILKIDRSFLWLLPVIFVQGKQKQTCSTSKWGRLRREAMSKSNFVVIVISSRIVILVLIQRIFIYIIWFNGHNLAYPPILRYTWGCIPTIVITWLISYNTVYNGI